MWDLKKSSYVVTLQMCLAPLWRAYASLEDGSDIAATLGKMMAKLSLAQVSIVRPDFGIDNVESRLAGT